MPAVGRARPTSGFQAGTGETIRRIRRSPHQKCAGRRPMLRNRGWGGLVQAGRDDQLDGVAASDPGLYPHRHFSGASAPASARSPASSPSGSCRTFHETARRRSLTPTSMSGSRTLHVRAGRDEPIGFELNHRTPTFPSSSAGSSPICCRSGTSGRKCWVCWAPGCSTIRPGSSTGSWMDRIAHARHGQLKDMVGQLTVRPFQRHSRSPLYRLAWDLAGHAEKMTPDVPFPNRCGMCSSPTTERPWPTACGRIWPRRPPTSTRVPGFCGLARQTQVVTKAAVTRPIVTTAWQVDAAYLLTGETAASGSIPSIRSIPSMVSGARFS